MTRFVVVVALLFALGAVVMLVLYGLLKAVSRRGFRPAASGVVAGAPDTVAARIADLASRQRGLQVAVDSAGTVTWRRGFSAAAFEHQFRAEVRAAGSGAGGEALSEVRVEFRLPYSLYDWGAAKRLARRLLADLGREPLR